MSLVAVHRHALASVAAGDTAGRRLLLLVLQTSTRVEVAERCGCTSQEIGLLASGTRRPGLRLAFAIEDAGYGINARAWLG